MKTYSIYEQPSIEPIEISEVKCVLKIDSMDEDFILSSFISVARQLIERYTGLSLITQKWKLVMDNLSETYLCHYPTSVIDSIKTYDYDNTATTWANTNYRLDTDRNKIYFNEDYVFPTEIRENAGVEIIYTAGFGTSEDIPAPIRQALLIMISALYECRGVCNDIPFVCKTLLAPYRDLAMLGSREEEFDYYD